MITFSLQDEFGFVSIDWDGGNAERGISDRPTV